MFENIANKKQVLLWMGWDCCSLKYPFSKTKTKTKTKFHSKTLSVITYNVLISFMKSNEP